MLAERKKLANQPICKGLQNGLKDIEISFKIDQKFNWAEKQDYFILKWRWERDHWEAIAKINPIKCLCNEMISNSSISLVSDDG